MNLKHGVLDEVSIISKIGLSPRDKSLLWRNIDRQIDEGSSLPVRRKPPFFKKRAVSFAGLVACLCISTGTVAWADGVNVLNVVVQFINNITNGGGFGTGYGLEHTAVSLTLNTNNSSTTNQTKGQSGTVQQAQTLTTTQMMSDGGLFDIGYNSQLTSYLGTSNFPKLTGGTLLINNIQAYAIDRSKSIFYMYVNASIPKSTQWVGLDVYHKTGGTVVINGQTLANIKKQVNISGITATYVDFTNNSTFLNYLTWKSGNWIFVLRSNNVDETNLVKYAQGIESQVESN
ncbi:hypothetical protein LLE49_07710 [Alicyclobacillus tolerans]|uniref:hypothetical protein n=1 Tax=Alicyclobacillus tolerans TaxID=90970 RepID=UPI001F1F057C|nr:hypothetical protein [Alicyclobacillus tolerans]MCF8564630.1 hypothetical protein [Alicyclobacillus tolerans]